MISSQEIRTVTFEKSMRGYRAEDVDSFLQQVADTIDELTKEKEESRKKLYILAQKIEEYRKDEDNLKTALLNAQRMGENVIHEAKQKAEEIIRKARIGAEDITRQAHEQVQDETLEYQRISAEVAAFKTNVLNLYRQHIESLSTLPGHEDEVPAEKEEEPVQSPEEPAVPAAQEPAAAEIDEPAQPAQQETRFGFQHLDPSSWYGMRAGRPPVPGCTPADKRARSEPSGPGAPKSGRKRLSPGGEAAGGKSGG